MSHESPLRSERLASALGRLADPRLSRAQRRHRERLNRLFAGERLDEPFFLRGISTGSTASEVDPESLVVDAICALADRAADATDERLFRPLLLCYNPHEVHFIDDLFGAEVFWHEISRGWQVRSWKRPAGSLEPPDLAASESWRLVREVAEVFVQIAPQNVSLVTPTFSSPVNIIINLYGDPVLADMLDRPDAVRRDLRVITDVIGTCHQWFLDRVPMEALQPIAAGGRFQPPGRGQVCGCANQLLSPGLYAELFAEFDSEILGLYPRGGMIHLCGAHAQHIPTWRGMETLASVQLNDRAADDLELYYDGLRDDQLLYVHECASVSVDLITATTEGGRRTVIVPEAR